MHIIYTYILTGAIHIYIYIHAHPINDEAFPTAPSTIRTRTRTPTQPQTLRRLFPTVDNRQRVHLVESSLHLLRTSSAPPRHLLCTSSACRRCLQSAQTVSPVWLWNCLRAKLKTKTGSHQRSERVAQLLLLLLLRLLLL